jgi:hypothetical protein
VFVVGFPADRNSSRWVSLSRLVCPWLMASIMRVGPRPAAYPTVEREPVQNRADLVCATHGHESRLRSASWPACRQEKPSQPTAMRLPRALDEARSATHPICSKVFGLESSLFSVSVVVYTRNRVRMRRLNLLSYIFHVAPSGSSSSSVCIAAASYQTFDTNLACK